MAIYHGNVDFDLDFDVVASGIVVKPVGMPVQRTEYFGTYF